MKFKLTALCFALSLIGMQNAMADHFDMVDRTVGDEAAALNYFAGSAGTPISDTEPLWQNLSSEAGAIAIGYNGIENLDLLYAVNPDDGGIYAYRESGFDDDLVWDKVGGPGKQFAVAGGSLYGVSTDGQSVYQYVGHGWQWVGGATDKLYAGEGGLFRTVAGSGDIYIYNNQPGSWSRVGGPGAQFAVGGYGKLYGISNSGGALYQWSGVVGGRWTRIRDSVKEVYANGNSVFVVDANSDDFYRYDGTPYSWTRVGGPGKQFAVVNDDLVYAISPDGNGVWRFAASHWERIGEAADSLYAAGEELVVKAKYNDSLWRYLGSAPEQANFVIIVKDDQMAATTREFVAWKKSIGHKVSVVTATEIESFVSGRDLAEKIRNYLVDVNAGNLHYVMLVGNVDEIPTRLLYPGWTTLLEKPHDLAYAADYYYADLHTTDWDLDNDDKWGEFSDDDYDWEHDVVVSRIPNNDPLAVEEILANIVDFEQDDRDWKYNSLQLAAFLDERTDSAELVELLDRDVFGPNWLIDKLYIDEPATATQAGEQSLYIALPAVQRLTQANYLATIAPQSHSLVVLTAHGNPTAMESHSCNWYYQDGEYHCAYKHQVWFGQENNVGADFTSAIVGLNGCSTAPPLVHPNDKGLLPGDPNKRIPVDKSLFDTVGSTMLRHNGQAYLEGGAVSVIGASAGSDYQSGWTSPTQDGSSTLFYLIQENLVGQQMSVGDAFFNAQYDYAEDNGLARGIRAFYLMGDPSLKIVGYGRQ